MKPYYDDGTPQEPMYDLVNDDTHELRMDEDTGQFFARREAGPWQPLVWYRGVIPQTDIVRSTIVEHRRKPIRDGCLVSAWGCTCGASPVDDFERHVAIAIVHALGWR